MLLIASPLLAANAFAILHFSLLLQDGLIGAGVGTILSKAVIQRRERIGDEQSPRRIRQVEFAWTSLLGAVGLVLGSLLRLLFNL